MDDWDPHVILGVAPDATRDDIRRAYRRLARMYHPDTNPGDERANKRFRMIQRAYRSLSDAELSVPPAQDDGPRPPQPQGGGRVVVDVDGSGVYGSGQVDSDSGESDIEDEAFFESLADGSELGWSGTPPAVIVDDDDASMPVPPTKPRLRVVRADVCLKQVLKPGATYLDVPGFGRAAVKIPAGADTGTVVPAIVRKNDTVEQLAVELRLLPDPAFRRRGLDLLTRYRVGAQTAWRGKSTFIETPWGQVRLTIPARSRWGDVVRIPCKGIMGQGGWGSLFVELSKH